MTTMIMKPTVSASCVSEDGDGDDGDVDDHDEDDDDDDDNDDDDYFEANKQTVPASCLAQISSEAKTVQRPEINISQYMIYNCGLPIIMEISDFILSLISKGCTVTSA